MTFRASFLALVLGFLCVSLAGAAHAQEPGSEEEAREAFRLGSEAADEERWADSERYFRRAYELSGVSTALFNRAVALRALGRHREARDAFAEVLSAGLPEDVRTTAIVLHHESAERVARISLRGLAADAEHEVRIDGEARPDDLSRPLVLEANEGSRTVIVTREGHLPFQWDGLLAPGSVELVDVTLEPAPERTVMVEPGTPIHEEPAFWIILVGAVAAGAAIAIWVGVTVLEDSRPPPLVPASENVFRL